MVKREYVEKIIKEVFESYGFQRIQTPTFKEFKFFAARSGPEIRDCLGFDGRKVSLNVPKEEGLENLFVRYIERPEKWASIPATIKEEYEKLYNSFFNLIQRALVCEGIQTELVPLKTNHCIYALKIRKIK